MKTTASLSFALGLGCVLLVAVLTTAHAQPRAGTTSSPAAASPGVALTIELDRPVLPADSRETAIVKVALHGGLPPATVRRAPVNLALVIDKSGSMSGDRIARAREAAMTAVRRLGRDDIVSLIAFDNDVYTLIPARRVGDGATILEAIENISAQGGTHLHGGVVAGAEALRRHLEEGYTHRVILLSDGQANVGPQTPEALGNLGAQLMRDGISVSTIGLGLDFNEDLMTRLARRSDGNTYFVENSRDLGRIFNEELGDVLSIVARRVVVELSFPEGVRPVRFVGREGRIDDRRAYLELNQLYGSQEKFALIEVEVSPTRPGATREVARAELRYEDAIAARAATQSARVNVTFSAAPAEIVKSANLAVQAAYAANRYAEAKDEAIALVDAGRRAEGAQRLREVGDSLNLLGRTYSNIGVLNVAAPAATTADKVATEGLSAAERKDSRAVSQQIYNQQRAK